MQKRKTRKDKIVFSSEQLQIMERLAGHGLTVKQICYIMGVSPDTIYRRIAEGCDELSAILQRGKAIAISKVAEVAYELALEGDSGMIKYILSTQAGWTEKSQITIEGGENPLLVSNISDSQVKRMAKEFLSEESSDE